MKRPSPFPPLQTDTIQPARSHYLDFRVGRAAAAAAAAAASPPPPPSMVVGGGGVSALSLPSPDSNNTATQSCFANFGCRFDAYGSSFSGGGGGQGTRTSTTAPYISTATSTTASTEQNDHEEDEDDPTTFIAKEMNRLSIPERELAYEDMHGVACAIQETPEFVSRALLQLEEEISKIPNKSAYDLAKTTLPNGEQYVYDSKLRLMFLRCVRFHPEKAAKRFIGWLDWKLQLFGPEKLCQSYITLDDLSDDAKWVVESGLFQFLPSRDSRGRAVLFISNQYTNRFFKSKQAALQMLFYILMNHIVDDEITQRNGMVYIIYNVGDNEMDKPHHPLNTFDVMQDKKDLGSYIPIRLAALHIIVSNKSNSPMRYWLSWAVKSLEAYVNVRIRIHYGSHIECEYALASFGIPRSYFPVTSDGELKTNNHKKWIQRRKIKEKYYYSHHQVVVELEDDPFPGIELPNNNDVLLGQGKPLQYHPGNRRLLDVIQYFSEEYNLAPRHGRTQVARKVIQEIKKGQGQQESGDGTGTGTGGGRFLKLRSDSFKSGWWEEVTDEDVILERIRNGFRNTRRSKTHV